MTVVRWSPQREMVSLREAMDRLFEDSFLPRWRREGGEEGMKLPIDVYTTPEEIVIMASMPGLTPDEVDISIEGDTLTIRGELHPPLENVDYIFRERVHGAFYRALTLNVPVDAEKAEARFENGVLTLTLPKVEAAKPKVIKVKSTGQAS